MKHSTGFQQLISLILIFCLLTELTGCHSNQMFSTSEIVPETFYMVHAGNKINYKTFNMSVKDSVMHGNIYFNKLDRDTKINAHIYLNPDSTLVVNNENIEFSLGSVTKMTEQVNDKNKTQKLVGFLVLGSIIGVAVVAIAVNVIGGYIDESCANIESACTDINLDFEL